MLTQRLNLTADQQTQVKAVLTEQRQKMEALRNAAPADSADSSQATPNRRQQMEAIRTDTDTKITALLNDDQKAKYAAMVQKRNQRMEEHGGAPPPPPPGV
jgi:Spy/CpxP family protein refolding chaperone